MKKILSLTFAIILLITLCIPTFAFTQFHDAEAPRVIDAANIISDNVEQQIVTIYAKWQQEYSTDVVLVTTTEIWDYTIDDFAADFYDYNGYGIGDDFSGIIMVICVEPGNRCYSIVTTGKEIDRFDRKIEPMYDCIDKYLHENDFDGAAIAYTGLVGSMLEYGKLQNAKAIISSEFGESVANDKNVKIPSKAYQGFLTALIVGLIIGLIVVETFKRQMAPVQLAVSARNYLLQDSFHLRRQTVMFIRSEVTKRAIPKDSGGKGSIGHSGVSHGGGGGRSF